MNSINSYCNIKLVNQNNPEIFKKFQGVLLLLIQGNPNTVKLRINMYGIMKQYFDAVNLALERPSNEFQELAIRWASRTNDNILKKRLWMRIAKHFLAISDEKVIELLKLKNCPIKIADIIGFFDDDQKINSFKQLIESSLRGYNKKIEEYNSTLDKYQKISDYLKEKNNSLSKKFYVFDFDRKCNICQKSVFGGAFYYFNCYHVFHRDCIKKKFEQNREFCSEEEFVVINMTEMAIQNLVQKSNFRFSS